jgi:NAD+ synthase
MNIISNFIKEQALFMRREGMVIGLSGGIDSSVCAELCVHALGKDRVLGLILPEKESNPISKEYAIQHARKLEIDTVTIDVTSALETLGTYANRDKVIKEVFPEYGSNYRIKITLPPDLLSRDSFSFFTLTIDDGEGNVRSARLNKNQLNGIVAATNTKQRTRMMQLYYYAEKMNFLVCGTTNKTEVIQGYFVKYGDGGVDIEPTAHLYKTQVFQLAEDMGIPDEIRKRKPSPDTYSFQVSDEEFYFRIPYDKLDLLLYAWEKEIPVSEVCSIMDLREDQVARAFRDFTSKYNATNHMRRLPPSLSSEGEKEQ